MSIFFRFLTGIDSRDNLVEDFDLGLHPFEPLSAIFASFINADDPLNRCHQFCV